MEDERSIRVQAGCAILFLFDLIALCILLWFALGAGMLTPMDCTIEHRPACNAASAAYSRWLALIFLATVAVNAGFLAWAIRRPRRGP